MRLEGREKRIIHVDDMRLQLGRGDDRSCRIIGILVDGGGDELVTHVFDLRPLPIA